MDLRILLSMLSVMCTGILQTVVSAPTASSSVPHVRTKRCSCATFLDKECVYFCHLDIIWVNTPERVVSYGLGSAPRQRRSVAPSADSHGGARCTCRRENDRTCTGFCQLDNQYRYETLPDKATLPRRGRRRRGEAPPTEAGSGSKYPEEQQGGGAAPARRSRTEGSSAAGEVEGEAAPRGERGRNPVKPHHLFGQRAGGISKA